MENKSQNTMSNAEEILRSKLNDRFGDGSPYKDIADWALTEFIAKVMQAHTRQRLDELKEKVEALEITKEEAMSNPNISDGFGIGIDKVITLIDEAINE